MRIHQKIRGGYIILLREKERKEKKAGRKNIPPFSEKISPLWKKGELSPPKIMVIGEKKYI